MTVKSGHEAFDYTGATHDMFPKYGSFLSYLHYYSGDYVTLGNRGKYPIVGCSTSLVRLGGRLYRRGTYFKSQDSSPPSNLCDISIDYHTLATFGTIRIPTCSSPPFPSPSMTGWTTWSHKNEWGYHTCMW